MSLLNRIPARRYATVKLSDGTPLRLRSLMRSEQRQLRARVKDRMEYYDDCLLALSIVNGTGEPEVSIETALEGFFDQWEMRDIQVILNAAMDLNIPDKEVTRIEDVVKN